MSPDGTTIPLSVEGYFPFLPTRIPAAPAFFGGSSESHDAPAADALVPFVEGGIEDEAADAVFEEVAADGAIDSEVEEDALWADAPCRAEQ